MNKFATIKYLMDIMSQDYGYKTEQFSSRDMNETFWGVFRYEGDKKVAMVFLDDTDFFKIDEQTYRSRTYWEYSDLKLIKIIFSDDQRWLDSNFTKDITERVIVISNRNERIYFFTREEEVIALQLNNLLDNRKKYDTKRKRGIDTAATATYVLITINVLMFILTSIFSGNFIDSNIEVLIYFGAKVNSLIRGGEYYRLLTSAFLHGGFIHLAVNMYALNALGPLVEKVYGRIKFLIIYFVSAFVASIFSFSFSASVSVGASGAIFGLLGATLIFAYKMRNKIGTKMVSNILSVIALNAFLGLALPNIDNFGHLGGLVGGTLISLALGLKKLR
ncbi:hypothetical protein SH2C18_37590 [Clostridium sediminicola]|uniref:rhomboid family intramembrane serine protease n=1 Tax=Clostridium sediminicola TaxID=3114879 RepID=UPI0031F1F162